MIDFLISLTIILSSFPLFYILDKAVDNLATQKGWLIFPIGMLAIFLWVYLALFIVSFRSYAS